MSGDAALTRFLGDREHTFRLTPKFIPELEHVTGAGIGTLFKRLAEGHFHFAEIMHTIRLGLVGGGMCPKDAAHLCSSYVEDRPIAETWPIALAILERLWLGAGVVEAVLSEIERAANA